MTRGRIEWLCFDGANSTKRFPIATKIKTNVILYLNNDALSGVWGNRGKWAFISTEQENKGQNLRGTGEQRQYWVTAMIRGVRKKATSRNRYDQVPHLTQDTLWESGKNTGNITYKRAKVDNKAARNIHDCMAKTNTNNK